MAIMSHPYIDHELHIMSSYIGTFSTMILTDESVITLFRSKPRFGDHKSYNHGFQSTQEELAYLLGFAVNQLQLPVDSTTYLVQHDNPLSLTINTIYTHITFGYHKHTSKPDLVIYTNNGLNLIKLCVSYKPIKSHISQLGLTHYLVSKLGYNIASTYLYCINSHFHIGSNDHSFFMPYHMTKQSRKLSSKITTHLGDHSKKLSLASIKSDSSLSHGVAGSHTPPATPDIFYLINMSYKDKLRHFESGIVTFQDILNRLPNITHVQQQQCNVEISQKPYLNLPYVQSFFASLTSHIHCFDSEACQFPYPVLFAKQPFEMFPFLFSCHHLDTATDTCTHSLNFYFPDHDFRRDFAETLISCINPTQSILVFDATLERKLLCLLADLFPDLKSILMNILNQCVDLSTLFINHHVILPGMKGKSSIKHIIHALNHTDCYDSLTIQSGFFASHYYKQLIYDRSCDQLKIKHMLSEYCTMDTKALVSIYQSLVSIMD